MKKLQKAVVVLLTLVMTLTLFAGCAKDAEKGATDSGATDSTGTEATEESAGTNAEGPVVGGEMTFSYWSADTTAGQLDDGYKSPVSQTIKDVTGVTLEKEFAIGGDPSEKLSFMAASGEYPDLIYALEYSNIIVNAGGFIRLDELIDEYGPNIKKNYMEMILQDFVIHKKILPSIF